MDFFCFLDADNDMRIDIPETREQFVRNALLYVAGTSRINTSLGHKARQAGYLGADR